MKALQTDYTIKVYILTDSLGEWWEYVKNDGSTRMWQGSTAILNKDKSFKTAKAAINYAKKHFTHCKVMQNVPPVRPSIEWTSTVVHEIVPELA